MLEKYFYIRSHRISVSWVNPFEWDELVADYGLEENWWFGVNREFKSLRIAGFEVTLVR